MNIFSKNTGIGMSPRPRMLHQRIIRHALRNASYELEQQGLEMLSETTVTNNLNDLVPDLIVFNAQEYPLSIIEITTHRDLRRNNIKCHKLLNRFPMSEYFVYDYEKGVLYKYELGEWVSSLQEDLRSDYLSQPLISYFHK